VAVVRYALAVVLGLALVASAIPLIEDVRRSTARVSADHSVDRLRGVIRALVERSDPTAASFAAGRSITLTIPDAGPGTVGVDWVAIGGVPERQGPVEPNGTDVIAYSVDGEIHHIALAGVEIQTASGKQRHGDETPLVIEGTTTLRLTYRLDGNQPVVLVRPERL
jgi:hypothetical protein